MSNLPLNTSQTPYKRHIDWAGILAVGILISSGLIYLPYFYHALGPFAVLLIYDLCVFVSALAGAILAVLLWRSYDRGETLSKIWAGLAIGLVMWLVAEFIWSSDQLWGDKSLPYPSSADILWILGYIPVIWALSRRFLTLRITLNHWRQKSILLAYGLIVVFVVIYIFVPIISDTETTKVYEKTINLLYPLGDLIVAFLTILLVLAHSGGALIEPWRLIAGGFLMAAISDLLYGVTLWQGSYQINPAETINTVNLIINISYVAFYVLVALGFYKRARMQNAL